MTATVLLSGPPLDPRRALEVMRAIAPLIAGRALSLVDVDTRPLPDQNGAGACWTSTWRDGDVSITACVSNGDGNPRDGYGYGVSVKLFGTYQDKPHWRGEMNGGSYNPILESPIRIGLLAVSPDAFEAVRVHLRQLLPEYSDSSLEDSYAIRDTITDFMVHGHDGWVRTFLSRPLLPDMNWVTAAICEKKIELMGPDATTARTWVTRDPGAAMGWRALAESGGDAVNSAHEARWMAALAHPWGHSWLDGACAAFGHEGHALKQAMAHIFSDPRWRAFTDADVAGLEHDPTWRTPGAPSARVTWTPAGVPAGQDIDELVARALGFPTPPMWVRGSLPCVYGPPVAPPGLLPGTFGIGTGHGVRRAVVEPVTPVTLSRAFSTCHVNCEDRISSFGLFWWGPQRQVVWRSSMSLVAGAPVHTGVVLDVLDGAGGAWAQEVAANLRKGLPRGWTAA